MATKHKNMNIKKMSKSALELSIGKSLVKAARWEARGSACLAEGQWPKAIDAFERKLWWIKHADSTRRHGTVWADPTNPEHPNSGSVATTDC
jgi:hypothetical protein